MEDPGSLITKPMPYDRASFLNRNFFCWMIPLFNLGMRKDLEIDDLWKNPQVDGSERLGNRLQQEWDNELKNSKISNRKPSLFWAIYRVFGFWYLMSAALCLIMESVLRVLQQIVMGMMIYYLQQYKISKNHDQENYFRLSAGLVVLIGVFYVLLYHPFFFKMARKGMQLRIACCSLVYRKALRLSHEALSKTTVGQMVNLLSNDVNRFNYCFIFVPYIVTAPLQTIASIIYLYFNNFRWSVLVAFSILIIYIPFQIYTGGLFSKLRASTAILTDERIRLMNELIPAMRVIKMYTWERSFAKLVEWARRREVSVIKKTALLRSVNMALYYVSSKVVVFVCFLVFLLQGGKLEPQHVFVAITLFGCFRTCLTLYFPYGISQGSEALISIDRIQEFLLLDEKKTNTSFEKLSVLPGLEDKKGVYFDKALASWNSEHEPTLNNLTFNVTEKELLVVIGPVGSGKSSVLMSVLSEIPVYKGQVRVCGKISYASQQPWNFAGTVRENVLFGNKYIDVKYKKVMHVCALERDLQLFPLGDQTVIGDRGVSLSGGQRARINLARALYTDADIYLLDDPLSAVDAAVSKHIFEKCICGYLKEKSVILVTHQMQFIKQASKILVLKNGLQQGYGSYEQLMELGIDFVKIIKEEQEQQELKMKNAEKRRLSMQRSTSLNKKSLSMKLSINSSLNGEEPGEDLFEGEPVQSKTLTETRTSGSVKAQIYWIYVQNGAGFLLLLLLVSTSLASQILFNSSDYFLALWTDKENGRTTIIGDLTRSQCIMVFSLMVGLLFLLSLISTIAFFSICMNSSVNLHNRLFECLIRAPISFFDNNPIGVLLNRCSRDVGIVDDQVPPTAYDAVQIFSQLIGILTMVSIINYWIIPPTIILITMFYFIHHYYIVSARNLKRLEGIIRSPVFSHLSSSLFGLSTVRAFKVQKAFEKKFDYYQDCHTASWFLVISSTRWFGIVLDWLSVVYLSAVTLILCLTHDSRTSSEVGLSISYAITLSGMFQWGVRQAAELESQMTSVERIDEYSRIENEKNLEQSEQKPPKDWPSKGAISFTNVSLAYSSDSAPVLKNLTFQIRQQEKIGIVGRTGAGKSSMISTLFQMSPPTGKIVIDGVDTTKISLTDLRSKLSIIPQDPIIFAGPVRRNIDPFDEHSDEKLWQVLEEVQLKDVVQDLGGLDSSIADGGGNLSVGQRQLFCLARAILKQNRILILDEATANVDHKTDLFIQETIKRKFSQCTVLTIAHRLHTIMDSDRVMVLDAGRLIEFDEPRTLLQNKNGSFFNMVEMTGKNMAENLKKMAETAFEAKRLK